MAEIIHIVGREVFDSRGNPTVEAEVHLKGGYLGLAMVPSGASTGSREAIELRDQDNARFGGKGVLKAVDHINTTLRQALLGQDANQQREIDQLMIEVDGTENKGNLGANTILAVSLATAKAAAASQQLPLYAHIAELNGTPNQFSLPLPMMNVLNGGAHADNTLDIQEFMIQPIGGRTFKEALQIGVEVFHSLAKVLKSKKLMTTVGDEGGFAPNLSLQTEALDAICEAVEKARYTLGKDVAISLDCAASELYDSGSKQYVLASENKRFSSTSFTHYLEELTHKYPIISIEDGLDESDWEGWQHQTERLGKKLQLVGDDLFVTNTKLLQEGINRSIANAILIKPNQIGTLSETLAAIALAKGAGYATIISHRSGETEDGSIADLAVGTQAGQIKTGSASRSDRMAKYNQLLRIEEALGPGSTFAGLSAVRQTSL